MSMVYMRNYYGYKQSELYFLKERQVKGSFKMRGDEGWAVDMKQRMEKSSTGTRSL
jgi:hypothetical protein